LLLLLVLVNSTLLLVGSAQAETDESGSVGVKAGDWVKYKVTYLGTSDVWEEDASWTEAKVVSTSGSLVGMSETFHYGDGSELTRNWTYNLKDRSHAHAHYIVATNLGPGDKIGEACRMPEPNHFVWCDLVINNTESRTYGGVARIVYHMTFSDAYPHPDGNLSITADRYWDAETGVLLEYSTTGYWLGHEEYYETHLPSIYRVEIVDTNLWGTQRDTLHSWLWLVLIPTGLTTLAVETCSPEVWTKKEVGDQ
jgi:hypothetical protein